MYDAFDALPPAVVALPVAGLALAGVLLWLVARGERPRLRSSYAWMAGCACPLVVALGFGAAGALEGYVGDVAIACGLCVAATLLCSQRERVGRLVAGAPHAGAVERLRDLAALFVAVCALRFAIEIPWNPEWHLVWLGYVIIECALLAALVATGYFLCGRRGAGGLPAVALCVVASFAMHYVYAFRGEPIFPRDLFALGTAANVSGQYAYVVTSPMLIGLGCASVAVAALSFAYPVVERRGPAWGRALCSVGLAALTAWAGYALVTVPDYANDLQVTMLYWIEHAPLSYKAQGLLPSFVAALRDLPIREPEGYSDEGARALQERYAAAYDQTHAAQRAAATQQFDELRPSVVVVMNETFDDFSRFQQLRAGYQGPQFLNSLTGTLARGNLGVSVYGGGTCNTEFELLTGVSLEAVGAGKYPYSMYDLSGMASLPKQFRGLGYVTTAIHPNVPENWNRATVYPALGFDRFLDINSFAGAPWFHNGVTDKATYQKVLDLLAAEQAPQFVFDVTMQNHSGYDRGNIPAARLTHVQPEGLDDAEFNPLLNEYLSCIQASDEDLAWFIGQLGQLERPVVLLFFGDHQPYFSYWYNNEIFGEDEEWVDHEERIHQTVYFLYANYDVAGTPAADLVQDASPNYLGALLAGVSGAPLTDHQKAQLQARASVPAYNEHGYQGADGTWYVRDAQTEWLGVRDDQSQLDYLALEPVR